MLDHTQLRDLIVRAWTEGQGIRPGVMRSLWDMGGSCTDPVGVELHARPSAPWRFAGDRIEVDKYITVAAGHATPLTLTMLVRCRKCDACRRYRSRLWAARAMAETKASARTWFGTLTLAPEARYRLLAQVSARMTRGGVDFERLAPIDKFREYAAEGGKELTLFLKRVRKESGAPLRYIAVTEEHRSGDPHWHLLIHETHALTPVRKSVLGPQWRLGYSQWRLADTGSARYVCKYLAKTCMARVRASLSYGETSLDIVQETIRFLNVKTPTPHYTREVGSAVTPNDFPRKED